MYVCIHCASKVDSFSIEILFRSLTTRYVTQTVFSKEMVWRKLRGYAGICLERLREVETTSVRERQVFTGPYPRDPNPHIPNIRQNYD